jgi:hypothetical protein
VMVAVQSGTPLRARARTLRLRVQLKRRVSARRGGDIVSLFSWRGKLKHRSWLFLVNSPPKKNRHMRSRDRGTNRIGIGIGIGIKT